MPINLTAFGTALQHAAWRNKPSWAVIATDDKAFDVRMLHKMARRMGAVTVEVPASHALFLTQPEAVAGVIEQAASSVARAAR